MEIISLKIAAKIVMKRSMGMSYPFYGNYPKQEDDKKAEPHFFLSKILIPFGSLLIAGIILLTSNYQLPKWVFISVVSFLILVSIYIVIIIGPTFKKISSNLLSSIQKKRNRARFSRYYLPQLNEKSNELAKFLEDRSSDSIIYLLEAISQWPELINKPSMFDREQLGNHAETLRTLLNIVQYSLKNASVRDFPVVARNLGRIIHEYHRFYLNWQRRLDNLVRQEMIQGEKLRYLKQEWFTRREKITKFIDQWKPIAENIDSIFEERICLDYFETIKTIE